MDFQVNWKTCLTCLHGKNALKTIEPNVLITFLALCILDEFILAKTLERRTNSCKCLVELLHMCSSLSCQTVQNKGYACEPSPQQG